MSDLVTAVASQQQPKVARTVVIAGASGFVGRALTAALLDDYDVIALSRDVDGQANGPHVSWRSCDLFNLRDAWSKGHHPASRADHWRGRVGFRHDVEARGETALQKFC